MSKNTLEIYNVGTKVKLADDVFGTIVSVSIASNNNVTYQCGWWNGRSYCIEYFNASDIETVVTTEKTRIGFA